MLLKSAATALSSAIRLGRHCYGQPMPQRQYYTPTFNPYTYTHGRWLHKDEERRIARSIKFDFQALLDVAVKCTSGAQRVLHCEKKEGGYNRVFLIQLDNDSQVIARLPTPLAGHLSLAVQSEVATLQYLNTRTRLTVPRVIASSAFTGTSPVGAEYMITTVVPGNALGDDWNSMNPLQHVECIRTLGDLAREVCEANYPAFGSLYLNTGRHAFPTVALDDDYCIGPHCAPQYWRCGPDDPVQIPQSMLHQGPWTTLKSYRMGQLSRAKTIVRGSSGGPEATTRHLSLLDTYDSLVELIAGQPSVQAASKPVLFHPDFHTRNIFVAEGDPTQITGIIDWQNSAIEPAYIPGSATPDFGMELRLDEDLDKTPSEEQSAIIDDSERCAKVWAALAFACSKMGKAIALDPVPRHFLAAPHMGWLTKEIELMSLISDVSRLSDLIGMTGESPYKLSAEDRERVRRMREDQDGRERMRAYLVRALGCHSDGWVSPENWDATLPLYRDIYDKWIATSLKEREVGETEAEARAAADRIWPFDLR